MNYRVCAFCLCLFFLPVGWSGGSRLQAQDLEDEFAAYLEDISAEFYTYLDSIDLVFATMLEDKWQELIVYEGADAPVYGRSPQASISSEAIVSTILPIVSQTVNVGLPIVPSAEPPSFYGQQVALPAMQEPLFTIGGMSEKQVADAWRALSRHDFTTLLAGVTRYCQSLSLNDWGKYLLLKHVVDTRFVSCPPHEQTLLLAYFLIHTGLDVKLAFAEQGLALLLPVREEVYQVPFVSLDEVKYYLLGVQGRRVKKLLASPHMYPGEAHPMSLVLNRPLDFAYDRHLMDLYATWPLCDLSVYFRAKPTRSFRQKTDALLRNELAGKSPIEQVSFLLRWVQESVTHISDTDRHEREIYYFPEESLYHGYADCEDLSVLLDWLIRTYTSYRCVTLLYTDHVAVAIEAPAGYTGQVLSHQGRAYIPCDPSYKGSPMGEVVPANKSLHPVVVSYH